MYWTNNMVTFCTIVTVYMIRWDKYYLLMNKLKTPVSLECALGGILQLQQHKRFCSLYLRVCNKPVFSSYITCVMFSVRGASWECFWTVFGEKHKPAVCCSSFSCNCGCGSSLVGLLEHYVLWKVCLSHSPICILTQCCVLLTQTISSKKKSAPDK